MTLIEFLNARLDEEQAAALRATPPGAWATEPADDDRAWLVVDEDAAATSATTTSAATALHISRHNPDRVLREIEAKRGILADHHPVDPCDAHDPGTGQTVPCTTLRWLASVYAVHPDYQQEWKP